MLKFFQFLSITFISGELTGSAYLRTRHQSAQEVSVVGNSVAKLSISPVAQYRSEAKYTYKIIRAAHNKIMLHKVGKDTFTA
jgi:hypothetical protein